MARVLEVGKGFEIKVPLAYEELKKWAEKTITEIVSKYPKAKKMWELLRNDPEVNADWDIAEYLTVAKMNINDHGEVHALITAANALKMLQILLKHGILPDIMKERAGDEDDAHLIILAGALLHDIGNLVHRDYHHITGVCLAIPILNRLLPQIYEDEEIMYEIRNHILHTIFAHEYKVEDFTLEAGIVGVADGTDMTKGRGRIAVEWGKIDIHAISALAVEKVEVTEGEYRPIRIHIKLSNSAGLFQIEKHLAVKIANSPLRDLIEVIAEAEPPEADSDKRIIHRIMVVDGKIKPF
ncbi:MAG: phosphohydrolase [Thermoprotei archaeon]|nr:MAG: phosphohydrolase [Thermoprotei archaeon]